MADPKKKYDFSDLKGKVWAGDTQASNIQTNTIDNTQSGNLSLVSPYKENQRAKANRRNISDISKASSVKNFLTPNIQSSNLVQQDNQVVEAPRARQADPVTQQILSPLNEGRQSIEELQQGKYGQSVVDFLRGGLHTAMAPVTAPMAIGSEAINATGDIGRQVNQGLENAMNVPFEAIKQGSELTNKALKEIGVDTDKISKTLGLSPKLNDKANQLLTELGGLYLMRKGHSVAKNYLDKTSPKIGVQNESAKVEQRGNETESNIGSRRGREGISTAGNAEIQQKAQNEGQTPINAGNVKKQTVIPADPKSRFIVNSIERRVNNAIKQGRPFDDKEIVKQLNDVIDPKEKDRLGEIYNKVLEHNKNIKGTNNAIQERGAKEILQRQQGTTGITGGGRERVESSEQGKETSETQEKTKATPKSTANVEQKVTSTEPAPVSQEVGQKTPKIDEKSLQPKETKEVTGGQDLGQKQPEIDANKSAATRMFNEGKKDTDVLEALGLKNVPENMDKVKEWRKEAGGDYYQNKLPIKERETWAKNIFPNNTPDRIKEVSINKKEIAPNDFNGFLTAMNKNEEISIRNPYTQGNLGEAGEQGDVVDIYKIKKLGNDSYLVELPSSIKENRILGNISEQRNLDTPISSKEVSDLMGIPYIYDLPTDYVSNPKEIWQMNGQQIEDYNKKNPDKRIRAYERANQIGKALQNKENVPETARLFYKNFMHEYRNIGEGLNDIEKEKLEQYDYVDVLPKNLRKGKLLNKPRDYQKMDVLSKMGKLRIVDTNNFPELKEQENLFEGKPENKTESAQPEWLKSNIDNYYNEAKNLGIIDKIEKLSAEGKTRKQVVNELSELKNNDHAPELVYSVRSKLGIPTQEDATEFKKWQEEWNKKNEPEILSTAIKQGNEIKTGETPNTKHDDIGETKPPESERGFIVKEGEKETFTGNREKAAKIANEAGQTEKPVKELHSEDLKPIEPAKETKTIGQGQTPEETYSLKNAIVETERKAKGQEPREKPETKSNITTQEKARNDVDSGLVDPMQYVNEVNNKPRTFSDEEDAAVKYYKTKLSNTYEELFKNTDILKKKGGNITSNIVRLKQMEEQLDTINSAADKAGTEWGRAGQMRSREMKNDYSLVAIKRKAKVANNMNELSTEQNTKIENLYKQLDEANRKVQERDERISKFEADKTIKKVVREENYKIRQTKRVISKENILLERSDLEKQLYKMMAGRVSALPIDTIPIMGKLATNYVKEGIVNAEAIVDKIYQSGKEYYDKAGVTKREIRDAISGYGHIAKTMTKDEIAKNLDEVKRQARMVSKLEDIESGKNPSIKKAPVGEPNPITAGLKSQVDIAMKKAGFKDNSEASLKSYKTRLQNRTFELQKMLDTQDFTKPEKKSLILDSEAERLKANVERIKSQVDGEIRRIQRENRPAMQKVLDWGNGWYRNILLSGTATIGKLTSYAIQKTIILKPIDAMESSLISKIPGLSKIAEKASIEGSSGNLDALAKNYTEFVKAWMDKKDIKNILKSGHGKLDEMYSRQGMYNSPEASEFFGHLHGVLKQPTKRASFMFALEKQSKWYLKNGYDLSDPTVQATANAAAYEYAIRDILLNDNVITDAYKAAMRTLQNDKYGGAGKVGASIAKYTLPIVKVPTNYVMDTAGYLGGGGKAGIMIYKAMKSGLENLKPEDANTIMRLVKKQAIGAVLFGIGYYKADSFGGYYQSGQKAKPDKLKPGRVSILGLELPVWASHNPAFEAMQFGATLRKLMDKRNGKEGDGVWTALLKTSKELSGEIPFFSDQLIPSTDVTKIVADKVRSIIPPDIQKIARAEDMSSNSKHGGVDYFITGRGEVQKRYPKGFKEEIEMGIPRLRKNISKIKKSKAKVGW
jgi:hypothetical protein